MWLYLPRCFISVVAHDYAVDWLVVRFRNKEHADYFSKMSSRILKSSTCMVRLFIRREEADYLYRCFMTRDEFASVMTHIIKEGLIYKNFKDRVTEVNKNSFNYLGVINEVYHATMGLDDRTKKW